MYVIIILFYHYRCNFIYSCLEIDANDRPEMDDIIDDLTKNSECLKPCLNAPTTSVIIEDTEELEIPPSSCQNTVTQSHSQKFSSVLHRRSIYGSMSQEKLNNVTVKRVNCNTSVKLPVQKQNSNIRTFIPIVVGRPRSNSVGTPEDYLKDKYSALYQDQNKQRSRNKSDKDKTNRYSEELIDTSAHNKYVPLLSNTVNYREQSIHVENQGDNFKELFQTVTSL